MTPIGVLIVDDQPGYAEVLASRLENEGWRIQAATSGEEALKILEGDGAIEILASDFLMPKGIDGAQLVNRALAYRPDLYTIIFTGWSDRDYAVKSLQAGVDVFLDKTEELAGDLKEAIRRGSQGIALSQIGRELLSNNSEEEVFYSIFSNLGRLREFDGCCLAVRGMPGDVCRIAKAVDLTTGEELREPEIFHQEDSVYRYVIDEARVYLPPLFQPEGRHLVPFLDDSRSIVVVPVTLKFRERGALGIEHREENRLGIDDLRFLNQVAHWISLAMQKLTHEDRVRQLEQERARNRRDLLARAVLHEIKNPLNNLAMVAQGLSTGLDGDNQKTLLKNVERINDVINNILKPLIRFEPLDEEVDLADVVEAAVSRFRSYDPDLRTRTRRDVPLGMPKLKGSRDMLISALVNLVENGAQAAGVGGEVEITAGYFPARGRVEVVVKNNGRGIPPDAVDRIFEYGFSRRAGLGTSGFGLPLTKDIVDLHGGEISVADVEGGGAAFKLSFPLQRFAS